MYFIRSGGYNGKLENCNLDSTVVVTDSNFAKAFDISIRDCLLLSQIYNIRGLEVNGDSIKISALSRSLSESFVTKALVFDNIPKECFVVDEVTGLLGFDTAGYFHYLIKNDIKKEVVSIPNGVDYLFGSDPLGDGDCYYDEYIHTKTLIIPSSVKVLKSDSLFRLDGLKNFRVPETVKYLEDFWFNGGVIADLPSHISHIPLCYGLRTDSGYLRIDDSVKSVGLNYVCVDTLDTGDSIDSIHNLFTNTLSVKTLIIGKNIKNFEFKEIEVLDLTTLIIKDDSTLSYISNLFLDDNDTLKKVVISGNVQYIADKAFKKCSKLNIVEFRNNNLLNIGSEAFYNCNELTNLDLPISLTHISESAFSKTGLRNIVIPENVYYIGYNAFSDSDLEEVIIKSNRLFNLNCFSNCKKLKSVQIQDGVIHIGAFAFNNCVSLKSIVFPSSVCHIDDNAFNGCINLESIRIPKHTVLNEKNFGSVIIERY